MLHSLSGSHISIDGDVQNWRPSEWVTLFLFLLTGTHLWYYALLCFTKTCHHIAHIWLRPLCLEMDIIRLGILMGLSDFAYFFSSFTFLYDTAANILQLKEVRDNYSVKIQRILRPRFLPTG